MHDYDQLSPEARHSYEALPLPFAIVRLCGSQSVLFSEGLCRLLHADRKTLTAALSNGFTGILHPDDRDKLRMAVSDACLRPDGDFKGTGRFAANGKDYIWTNLEGQVVHSADAPSLLYLHFARIKEKPEIQREEDSAQQRRNALVSHILATTQTAIFWKDANRRFLGVNQAFLDYYGFKDESVLLGKNDEEMGWHTEPDPYKNDELRILHYGICTYRIPGKCIAQGENRYIVASKAPLYLDGKIVGLVGSFDDVTGEEKQRREIARLNDELSQRIEDHKRLMEISDVCIVKIRLADYTLVEYNETMCQLIGYTREEYDKLFHGRMDNYFSGEYLQDLEKLKNAVRRTLREKRSSFSIELRMPTRTGFLQIGGAGSFEAIDPKTHAPKYMIAVYRDITNVLQSQTRLAQAALESERTALLASKNETLRRMLNGIPSGLASIHILNGVPSPLIRLNHYFFERVEIKGTADGLVQLRKFPTCLHPDDRKRCKQDLFKMLREKQLFSAQYRFQRAGGKDYYWGNVRSQIVRISDDTEILYSVFTDIDALKKSALALRESQIIYENTINATRLAVWTYDIVHHRIVMGRNTATAAACKRFGWQEIFEDAPESTLDCIEERDREKYLATFRRIEAGQNASCEIWYKSRQNDFEPFCARETYTVVSDEAGTPIKAYGIMQDITAEKKVRDRYERELGYLHQNNDNTLVAKGYYNLTQNTVLEYTTQNDRVYRVPSGKTYDEALMEFADQAYDPNEHRMILNNLSRQGLIQRYQRGEMWTNLQYRRALPDSLPMWISMDIHTYMMPENGDLACFTYAYDVTEKTFLDEIMGRIANEAFDYIGLIFARTNLFMFLKKTAAIQFPKELQQVSYAACCDYVEANFVNETEKKEFRESVSLTNIVNGLKDKERHCSVYHRTENGRLLCKQLDYTCLDKQLKIILVVRSDVTATYEREQKQLAAIEAAKLEADRANEAKTVFLSSMSHDLRTPLAGVLSFTEFALQAADPEKKQEYLRKISASGQLLLELVNDTLDLSRIESGKMTLDEDIVMPNELIPAVVLTLRPSAELRKLHLVTDFPETSMPVWCDKLKVQKIALNLISNSIKYTHEGGSISVHYEFDAPDSQGRNFRLVVEDSGIGMSEEFMRHMYEPFSQEKRSETIKVPGTGLGLSIVKRYVDLMGGTIAVKSRIHKGTRWEIALPLKTVSGGQPGEKEEKLAGTLAGKRVLLCEDNFVNIEIATMLLQNQHMLVESAENGKIGVDKFATSPEGYYDVILMDVRMPVMDGHTATRAIRRLERNDAKSVPIIALTADDFEESIREAHEAGMDAIVSKPIDPKKFRAALLGHLSSSSKPTEE